MSMRAAANQFGYLLGAGVGGLALAVGGFEALGVTLSSMFVTGALIHLPTRSRARTPVAQQATA